MESLDTDAIRRKRIERLRNDEDFMRRVDEVIARNREAADPPARRDSPPHGKSRAADS